MKSNYICRDFYEMKIEESILPLLGKTAKILDLYIDEKLANAGIPLSKLQFVLLMMISKNNGQPQCNLADISGRFKATFTRNISTLERNNLVTRELSPKDKRIKLIYITEKGEDFRQKSMPIISGIVKEVESEITEGDRAVFVKTLEKIKTTLLEKRLEKK